MSAPIITYYMYTGYVSIMSRHTNKESHPQNTFVVFWGFKNIIALHHVLSVAEKSVSKPIITVFQFFDYLFIMHWDWILAIGM